MQCATYIKVEKLIEFANGVHNLHQGANGAHIGKNESLRFPFPPLFRFRRPDPPQRTKVLENKDLKVSENHKVL